MGINNSEGVISVTDKLHTHYYKGTTTVNLGSGHEFSGTTTESPNEPGHMHALSGETARMDGHLHSYTLTTGPAVYNETGHFHYFRSNATVAFVPGNHAHMLDGTVSDVRD